MNSMELTKQTTQTRPTTLEEVREWLKRMGKDKKIIISPVTENIGDFGKVGVYICNTENSAEMEFVTVENGDVNELVDFLFIFNDVEKDWKEVYTKPQTLNDIRSWLIRSDRGWIFEMSNERMHGLSCGVEIKIPFNSIESAKEYGINLSGTKFITYGTEEGKELAGIIEFFTFYGVQPDWETDEENSTENSTDIFNFSISKPANIDEIEDWIRRVDRTIYAELKLKDIDCRSYICTSVFLRNPFDNVYELIMNKHHESNNYDEVINFLSERFGIKKDWV